MLFIHRGNDPLQGGRLPGSELKPVIGGTSVPGVSKLGMEYVLAVGDGI